MLLVSWTSLAPLFDRAMAPVKALPACVSAMALAPAAKLLVPPTVAAPVWLIAPPAVMLRFGPMAEVPSTVAPLLVSWALLVPLFDRPTAPVKALPAWVSVMALAPAAKLLVPPTVAAPVWLIAPVALTVRFRPIAEVPSAVAMLLVSWTSLAPLFDRLTAPVKAFAAWVRVM